MVVFLGGLQNKLPCYYTYNILFISAYYSMQLITYVKYTVTIRTTNDIISLQATLTEIVGEQEH